MADQETSLVATGDGVPTETETMIETEAGAMSEGGADLQDPDEGA